MSPKSNPEKPPLKPPWNPPKPPPALPSKAAEPNWSYCFLFVSSLNTEYASPISLNFSAAPGSLFTSGWYFLLVF